jgi:hypothetical protein
LGHLFLNIYTNYFHSKINHCCFLVFADDRNFFSRITSIETASVV